MERAKRRATRLRAMVPALAAAASFAGCGLVLDLPSSLTLADAGEAGHTADAATDATDANGEAAADAEPTPTPLALNLKAPFAIATDGTNVFWSDSVDVELGQVPIHGGLPQTVGNIGAYPGALVAVDDSGVYWAAAYSVWKSPPDGGSVSPWAPGGLVTPEGIATDGQYVYVADHASSGNILKLAEQGGDDGGVRLDYGACSPLWDSGLPTFGGLAVGGGNLFWTGVAPPAAGAPPSGVLATSTVAGPQCSAFASGQASPGAIVTDGTDVYWLTRGTPPQYADGGLHLVNTANPTVVKDLAVVAGASGLAMDATAVYWTSAGTPPSYTDGSVWRMSRGADGTGPIVAIARNRKQPGAIALGADTVVWAESGAPALDGGPVYGAGGLWKMGR